MRTRTTNAEDPSKQRSAGVNDADLAAVAGNRAETMGAGVPVSAAVTRERRRADGADREIAEISQQSLVPDVAPAIAGWEIATLYRAAGASEVPVGGDFYDFVASNDGWTVILGDVAGKGVEAAEMAASVRNGARFVSQTEHGTAAILARLDEALRQRSTLSLCSALCLSLNGNRLLFSSAGHPAPLIIRRDGRIREIRGAGPILGFSHNSVWPERSVLMEPEETILLYTDGVTDTRGATQRFGQRRLEELLVEQADSSPSDLLAHLAGALEQFQLGPQGDDTAALALRVEPPSVPGGQERVGSERSSTVTGPAVSASGLEVNRIAPRLDLNTIVTATGRSIDAAGEIDHATAGRLWTAFQAADNGAGSELVLDLARVTFVDSVGLRTVIEIERRARERGLSLQIIPPPERVRAVFRLSGTERDLRFKDQLAQGPAEVDYAERVDLELPVGEDAPHIARCEVRDATADKLSPPDSEVAVLLTSELVTNAVVHPVHGDKDSIGLRISADSGRVRVEVADSGDGFIPTPPSKDQAAGGRGLMIVDRCAVCWGTSRDDRFRVWFVLS